MASILLASLTSYARSSQILHWMCAPCPLPSGTGSWSRWTSPWWRWRQLTTRCSTRRPGLSWPLLLLTGNVHGEELGWKDLDLRQQVFFGNCSTFFFQLKTDCQEFCQTHPVTASTAPTQQLQTLPTACSSVSAPGRLGHGCSLLWDSMTTLLLLPALSSWNSKLKTPQRCPWSGSSHRPYFISGECGPVEKLQVLLSPEQF